MTPQTQDETGMANRNAELEKLPKRLKPFKCCECSNNAEYIENGEWAVCEKHAGGSR